MVLDNTALLAVDVQNDFCEGGALAVPEANQIIPVLNSYINEFTTRGLLTVFSRDWHPRNSQHFQEFGGDWPVHCVQGTWGAEFHPDLSVPTTAIVVSKGMDPTSEGYSVFGGVGPHERPLAEVLAARQVEHLWVGGLATDHCVRASTLDALKAGFLVTLLEDATRGVSAEETSKAREEMRHGGARIRSRKSLWHRWSL